MFIYDSRADRKMCNVPKIIQKLNGEREGKHGASRSGVSNSEDCRPNPPEIMYLAPVINGFS